jgi:hypothetical protein
MVMHTCNLSIWEAEAGGWQVPHQPGLHSRREVHHHGASTAFWRHRGTLLLMVEREGGRSVAPLLRAPIS